MKKILFIATGGTIASADCGKGLEPTFSIDEILKYINHVPENCQIEGTSICSLDSTNIGPKEWIKMEKCIEETYEAYDGFILCHGTDTMAYSAAALYYMLENIEKPIAFTGSQIPIDQEGSDGPGNLEDALTYVNEKDAKGVVVVFGGKVICGNCAKKIKTKSFDAFSSINRTDIATVKEGVVHFLHPKKYSEKKPNFYRELSDKIAWVKLIPGILPYAVDDVISGKDAVVIEGYGTGGLPDDWMQSLKKAIQREKNTIFVITTQVLEEGTDIGKYAVGKQLLQYPNVVEGGELTTEALTGKLMWVCGRNNLKIEERLNQFQNVR